MSVIYFTSDWHFGHAGITQFRTDFPSMEFMEDCILDNHSHLTKRDVLYCLGDMAFDRRGLEKIARIPAKKILVRGNHDTLPTSDYMEVFDEVHGAVKYKGFWLTHIPIHPMELYRGINLHGHCHRGGPRELQVGEKDVWRRYYNVILEFNNYRPVSLQTLKARLRDVKQSINARAKNARA